ncbi:hypothetical protein AB0D57_15025 [Streptomyces sp. NPDC048275]|uniref:hypothetical protein n=1 Tax=Streptomyces sp. NPDC048275 TaxID=3155629 RepID=UPI0033C73702
MTVLTNAVAAGIPGRLATYRYTHRVDVVSLYLMETAGYEARFAGLTGDSLRQLETDTRNTDAPHDHVEYLNDTLTAWKGAIDAFDQAVTAADFEAIAHLPWDHPRTLGYCKASSAMDTWHACREAMHTAFLDWSLDLTGTVSIDEPSGPAPVIVADAHRVPDCTGYCVQDKVCATELADLPLDDDGHLVVELYAEPDELARVVVFAFGLSADFTALRTSDPAELSRTADKFYRFAGRIEHAAYVLDEIQQREADATAQASSKETTA